MTVPVLAFYLGILFRLPHIGPRVTARITDGHFIPDSQPWIRRATFFGLIAFVGFPLAATGSVGGSIFGRLLGLSRPATFVGIFTGSVIGNGLRYWFAEVIDPWIDKDSSLVQFGGRAVILAIIILLKRRYRTLRDRFATATVAGRSEENLREPPSPEFSAFLQSQYR